MSRSLTKFLLLLAGKACRSVIQIGYRKRLCIYLGEGWSALCLTTGRHRPVVLQKAILPCVPSHDGRPRLETALAAIEAWLKAYSIGATINWVIGIGHAQYLLLPWDERLRDASFCYALTAAMFAQRFPRSDLDFPSHRIRLGPLSYGQPRLVAAIPSDVVTSIEAFARQHNCRTGSISPILSVVWNRFFSRLRATSGTLALVEGQRVWRVSHNHGRITSVSLWPHPNERTQAHAVDGTYQFPVLDTTTPQDGGLTVPGLAPDDDARLAYALCGAI